MEPKTKIAQLSAHKWIHRLDVQLVAEMVEDVVEGDDGYLCDVSIFEFGQCGAAEMCHGGELLLCEMFLFSEFSDSATKFE